MITTYAVSVTVLTHLPTHVRHVVILQWTGTNIKTTFIFVEGTMNNRWNGYRCFKAQRDENGDLFPFGARYVVFKDGWLVGEYSNQSAADVGFFSQKPTGIRLSDYLGIDERLRNV
jgi:hypothetical protein